MKIILARTDKIGDAILTLPMAGILKSVNPAYEIMYLGRPYVEEIVSACPHVDRFINWDALQTMSEKQAAYELSKIGADVLIHASINKRLFKLAKMANIKQRVATGRRWFSWLYCNKLVNFSRRHTTKAEAELNLQLIKHLGANPDIPLSELHKYLNLQIKPAWQEEAMRYITPGFSNLIIHPGSNLSGQEWGEESYIELINTLPQDKIKVLVTGTREEIPRFQKLFASCPQAINLMGQTTLSGMLGLITLADGLVAASTGTLHLAAVLGKRALGLYTDRTYVGYSRWRPLGSVAECLVAKKVCFFPCKGCACSCINAITPSDVRRTLMSWLA